MNTLIRDVQSLNDFDDLHGEVISQPLASLDEILNTLGFGVVLITADKHEIVYANSRIFSMSGLPKESIIGKACHQLLCPAGKGSCPISDLGHTVDNSEKIFIRADGSHLPIIKTVVPLNIKGESYLMESIVDNSAQKNMQEILANTNDDLKEEMIKRKEVESKIRQLAYHDCLTGLPNRQLLIETISQNIILSETSVKLFAVVFLDLDGFKIINDTMGHATGDELLVKIAKRLVATLKESDVVARLGGDEFVLLIKNIDNIDEVKTEADKILACFNKPFNLNGQDFFITSSLGVALYPADGDCAETMIQNADIAMYKAKEAGRNQALFCNATMQEEVIDYMKLSNQLYSALKNNELELYYQPQVDATSNKIIGMEALIRWNNCSKGLVYPTEFIPIAEKTGLILPIGEWVIRTACKQNMAWQNVGLPKIPVAVNLSVLQFHDMNLTRMIKEILGETGLEPQFLELEITESVIIRELAAVIKTMNDLKNMGISISIDDFGTDYCSMQYLKDIPANKIKIAMPFIHGIAENKTDEAITKSIILLAKNLGLRIIAEGVEKKKQLSFLRKSKCNEIQGYYFSKAVQSSEMEMLLKNGLPCSRLSEISKKN